MNREIRHAWRHIAVLLGAVALALAWSGEVRAQGAGATLEGSAPAGSEVTVRNTATGLVRRTKVGDDGNYAVAGLPAGTYSVSAGPGTEQIVTLSVASTLSLDLSKLETVTVSGQRLAEVKTSEVGTIVLAAADPDGAAADAQLPRVRRYRAGHGVHRRFRRQHLAAGRRARTTARSTSTSTASARRTTSRRAESAASSSRRAIHSRSWRSANTRSSRPTTRPSTTRSRVRRSRPRPSPAPTSFEGEVFGTYTGENFRAETPSELAASTKTPSTGQGVRRRHRRPDHPGRTALLRDL